MTSHSPVELKFHLIGQGGAAVANWIDSRDCRDCTLLSPPARRFEVLGRVLINAQIAAGLRAYFAATPSLVLVLLLTVVQKIAIDAVVLRERCS